MRQEFVRGNGPTQEPLHYTQCGLDGIYLCNGYKIEEFDGETVVSVEDVDGLYEAIAEGFLHKALLMPKEIKFLRKLMDMTQADLARKLRCDVQTVARWEKGECDINGSSDLCIKAFFMGSRTKNVDLLRLAEELAELNISDFPQYFEETTDGWKPSRVA